MGLLIGFSHSLLIAGNFTPDKQIVYKTIDGVDLKQDVFDPDGHQSTDHSSAIIFFFGAGWSSGSTSQFYEQARFLADRGMVAMMLFNPVLDTTDKGYGLNKVEAARMTEISPCYHVRSGIVPTLVMHGTADKTVPFENAERFARLMKEAGNDCLLIPFAGKDHWFLMALFFA